MITMSVPKGSNPMTEKQAERMIEALKELTQQIARLYNRLGALLPGER